MFSTPFRCCVNPIAQQMIVLRALAPFRRLSTIRSRGDAALFLDLSPLNGLYVLAEFLEAAGVARE